MHSYKIIKNCQEKPHDTIYLEMPLGGNVLDCFFVFLREGGGDVFNISSPVDNFCSPGGVGVKS